MLLLGLLISSLYAAAPLPAFTSSNGACKLYYQKENSEYRLECPKERQTFKLTPTASLAEDYKRLEKSISAFSSDPAKDQLELKKLVLSHFEDKFRFEYPGDEALLISAIKEFNAFTENALEDCEKKDQEIKVTPFVDLQFDKDSLLKLERELVDRKMAQDGFINLGKLQGISLELNTKNDNFLHGVGRQFIDTTQPLPWWEGDDRGHTFGIKMSGEMNYENGSIKVTPYTDAYSELTRVDGKIRDEDNRRYQNFLTVDGVQIEVRVNQTNGDKYIKLIGSVEHLTDSDRGTAQNIQKAWHKLGNAIDYRYLDHRKDETRVQGGVAVGVEKSSAPLSWLGVKMAIEGKAQGSTAGLENSFVGLTTEVSVHSNELFRSHAGQTPLLEARLKADHKHYGTNETYTNIGVTLYGTVYSDKKGNVVKVFAGVEEHKDPFTRRYAHAEYENRSRADLIHTIGIKYERKF